MSASEPVGRNTAAELTIRNAMKVPATSPSRKTARHAVSPAVGRRSLLTMPEIPGIFSRGEQRQQAAQTNQRATDERRRNR